MLSLSLAKWHWDRIEVRNQLISKHYGGGQTGGFDYTKTNSGNSNEILVCGKPVLLTFALFF